MPLPHVDPIDLPDSIIVCRWHDPLVEELGHPMASEYVETFYLSTYGPTALWLARLLARAAEHGPATVPLAATAKALGVKPDLSRNAPLSKALTRLRVFGAARFMGDGLEVRTHLAPITRAQMVRLPPHLVAQLQEASA